MEKNLAVVSVLCCWVDCRLVSCGTMQPARMAGLFCVLEVSTKG